MKNFFIFTFTLISFSFLVSCNSTVQEEVLEVTESEYLEEVIETEELLEEVQSEETTEETEIND